MLNLLTKMKMATASSSTTMHCIQLLEAHNLNLRWCSMMDITNMKKQLDKQDSQNLILLLMYIPKDSSMEPMLMLIVMNNPTSSNLIRLIEYILLQLSYSAMELSLNKHLLMEKTAVSTLTMQPLLEMSFLSIIELDQLLKLNMKMTKE